MRDNIKPAYKGYLFQYSGASAALRTCFILKMNEIGGSDTGYRDQGDFAGAYAYFENAGVAAWKKIYRETNTPGNWWIANVWSAGSFYANTSVYWGTSTETPKLNINGPKQKNGICFGFCL